MSIARRADWRDVITPPQEVGGRKSRGVVIEMDFGGGGGGEGGGGGGGRVKGRK